MYFQFSPKHNTQISQNTISPRTRIIRTLCLCDCKSTMGGKFSRLANLQNLQNCLFLEELNLLSNLTAEQDCNNSEQSKPATHAFGRTVRNSGIRPAPGLCTVLFYLRKESFPETENYIKRNISGKSDNFKSILCRVICPNCKQALCAPYPERTLVFCTEWFIHSFTTAQ